MINRSSIEALRAIAHANNAKIKFTEASDSTYVDCEIVKGDLSLYVVLTKFGNSYYAYGLNSDIAPSELYMDLQTDESKALKKREEEIFKNVTLFLRKEITYHKNPSMFNKLRGYIEIQVDGKPVRVSQKNNLLKLPEA